MLPLEDTVIVVEDDPTLRSLMTDILAEVGAKPMAFETADDPLTHLLEIHGDYPLVSVDQSLPGQIQGNEFIELVRSRWPTIAPILTSGYLLDPNQVPPSTIYLHSRGHWTTWLPL